jgi:hypothetical protein
MKIDTLLKYVWLACGVAILLLILAGLFFVFGLDHLFRSNNYAMDNGITLVDSTQNTIEKIDWEITYGSPVALLGVSGYLMPVHLSYETDRTLKAGFGSYDDKTSINHPSNYLYVDHMFEVIRPLLNQKGLIIHSYYPQRQVLYPEEQPSGKQMTYMLFEIVTKDTNKNGQLDIEDQSDLYRSDLMANHLQAILQNQAIQSVEFFDEYNTILIHYKSSTDAQSKFARYDVVSGLLTEIGSLTQEIDRQKKLMQQ